ncbi:MAG: nucleotide pyrophosphohydrolase [Nanoarchaeota archaeon]
MTDDKTTIHELKEGVISFIKEREWDQFTTSKNLALSISLEAAELLEHYQWTDMHKDKSEIEKELADVLIYCLQFAHKNDIDISTAIQTKMILNGKKYPAKVKELDEYMKIKKDYRGKDSSD